MKIETLEIAGIHPALHAMRNPMDSWEMSDSKINYNSKIYFVDLYDVTIAYNIGEKDKDLSMRLQNAGPEHAKHLRMVMVWADITAPRYWWQEMDTYRAGVEKVSCSTMHKLMARPLELSDFENDCLDDKYNPIGELIVDINTRMDAWQNEEDPEEKNAIWRSIIQILPQSYLQKRTAAEHLLSKKRTPS